ncbi:MAG: carbohydrate porin [Bacteroidetes bacterium]|nr:carbohydrate porin [Bacteroidota bacterium]
MLTNYKKNADMLCFVLMKHFRIVCVVQILMVCSLIEAQVTEPDTLVVAMVPTDFNTLIYSQNRSIELGIEDESFNSDFFHRDAFSGNWWGVRNSMSESGVDFELVYKGEMFSNVSGGVEKGTTSLDNIDLIFSADLEKSLGLNAATFTLQFLGTSGGVPNDYAGTSQGISNIETVSTWKIYQLLLEKKFFNEQLSLLVGLYDLNSEFDARESSSIFINPSHGIGPDFSQSGNNGPSIFPTTSMAVRVKYEAEAGDYFQAALFDGIPGDPENPYGTQIQFNKDDGLLLTAELGFVSNIEEQLNSKIAIGAWSYTTDFEKFSLAGNDGDILSSEKNYGFYLSMEKLLSSSSEISERNLYGFLRIGYANENVNPNDYYFGAGLKSAGLFGGRENDEAGLAVAYSHSSSMFRESTAVQDDEILTSYEFNIEATYTFSITPWLIIQPDIQYIINPSYYPQLESALVLGSRMQLTF